MAETWRAHQAHIRLITHNHQPKPMMSALIHLDFPVEEEEDVKEVEEAQLFVTEVQCFVYRNKLLSFE